MMAARYIVFTDNVERMVSFYRDRMKMTILMPPEATDHDPKGWVRLVSGGVEVAIHRGKHHVFSKFECCDFKDPDGNTLQISNR